MVELGFCAKPHGIKGGFTFTLFNTEDSVLDNKSKIMLYPKSAESSIADIGEEFTIKSISFGNKVIVYLDGVDERNSCEKLIPFTIKVPRDSFPKLDEGEYYIGDLIGFTVIDPISGRELGEIVKNYDNGVQVIFVIRTERGELVDVPFVDKFFPKVDLEKRVAEVILPRFVRDR